MRPLVPTAVLAFSLAGSAHAQMTPVEPQSPSTPFAVGLVATLVPTVAGIALMATGSDAYDNTGATAGLLMAASGVVLGPSIGDWAGGLTGRGFAGFGLRTVALVGGFAAAFAICPYDCSGSTEAQIIALSGVGIATGLAVWDLATMKDAVRKHQQRRLAVMPTYTPSTRSYGVAVRMTF